MSTPTVTPITSVDLPPLRLESLRSNARNLEDRAKMVATLLQSSRAPLNLDEVRAYTQLVRDRANAILQLLGGR